MSELVSVALDRALDELIALVEGKQTLDFLTVPVWDDDSEDVKREKCEAAARERGFELGQVKTLMIVNKIRRFEPDQSDAEHQQRSANLIAELERATRPEGEAQQ